MEEEAALLGDYDDEVLENGRYQPRLVSLMVFSVCCTLTMTIFGIIFVPFVLCLWPVFQAYYNTLEVQLTRRALILRSGGTCFNCCCFARVEKTILLDRIQDIAITQGCIAKCFGVETLTIETAGQSGPYAGPEGVLVGLVGTRDFRDKVMRARHHYVEDGSKPAPRPRNDMGLGGLPFYPSAPGMEAKAPYEESQEWVPLIVRDLPLMVPLLTDIRDTLHRIADQGKAEGKAEG